jgi:hypothetical protein
LPARKQPGAGKTNLGMATGGTHGPCVSTGSRGTRKEDGTMIREPAARRHASSEVPKKPRFFGWLPETVNRVETHVSHRKQTIAHASTRDVPAHENFRKTFARESLESRAAYPGCSRSTSSSPAALPRAWRGLQSAEGAPKISAFMEFFGETGTVSKPGAARWASLFMDGFYPQIIAAVAAANSRAGAKTGQETQ